MARTRTLKPSFFRSQSLAKCSKDARLMFAGLLVVADDEGRGDATARLLATELFPWDNPADEEVDGWLNELAATDHIVLYEHRGKRLFAIPTFVEHQSAAYRRGGSKLPPPPGFDDDPHKVAQPVVQEDAEPCLNRTEQKGKEEKGTDRAAQIGTLSTVTPTDGSGEPLSRSPRECAIAKAYGTNQTTQAIATGKKVGKFTAYADSIARAALNNPELCRLSDMFPTAPEGVIAAALAGDKHSLNNYPRADELPPAPPPEATVIAFKPRTEESA